MSSRRQHTSRARIKEQLALLLREEILRGRIHAGQRIIEGWWARKFGVAQASVREAINLLVAEGFVVKRVGRSARVVKYSEEDIARVYEIRAALEGMAAYLACRAHADLSKLENTVDAMALAGKRGDMRALIESDLQYHLALGEASGNPLLAESLRKLLTPLFAFALLRVLQSGQGPLAWESDLRFHRRMIEMIREGNPGIAQQYVQHCVSGFVSSAYEVWGNAAAAKVQEDQKKSLRSSRMKK